MSFCRRFRSLTAFAAEWCVLPGEEGGKDGRREIPLNAIALRGMVQRVRGIMGKKMGGGEKRAVARNPTAAHLFPF